MLDRATKLALAGIAPKPFDHAILAGILVAAERLWATGERTLSFCEADTDLSTLGTVWSSEARAAARVRLGTPLGLWRFHANAT
jgi:hypothetical protein